MNSETDFVTSHKAKIKQAFSLFDHNSSNRIAKQDIATLIRYLGYFPSDEDIQSMILPDLIQSKKQLAAGSDITNINQTVGSTVDGDVEIEYDVFESKMLEIMKKKQYPTESIETVIRAFETIEKYLCETNPNYQASSTSNENDNNNNTTENEKKNDGLKGFIYKDDFISLMNQNEWGLNGTECEEFLKMAITTSDPADRENEKIYLYDYCDELQNQILEIPK